MPEPVTVSKLSYTSASGIFPMKVVLHPRLRESVIERKQILPIHIQLNPENGCNLHCSFCSCSKRQRSQRMSLQNVLKTMEMFKECGAEACTVTGGGEPLHHPQINDIITGIRDLDIKVGLVTNGILLQSASRDALKDLTWVRVSFADERAWDGEFVSTLDRATDIAHHVGWAFSYVVSRRPQISKLIAVLEYAKEHNFTHVRVVSDLLDLGHVDIGNLRDAVRARGVDDSIAIYQDRQDFRPGIKDCWISLLKPVVSADGKLYGCCGSQYSEKVPGRDYVRSRCMGDALKDWPRIFQTQEPYDGAECVRCYYQHYNDCLRTMLTNIEHPEFV